MFDPPVTTVGFDVVDLTGGISCQVEVYGPEGLITSNLVPSSAAGVFWGIHSDVAIGMVILESPTGSGEGADNIAFGGAETVPVSNWALYLGIFLILIFTVLRFRKIF